MTNKQKMLDKEKLDAVFVTTTTHARALICINAVVVELKYPLKQGLAIGGYFFGEKGKVEIDYYGQLVSNPPELIVDAPPPPVRTPDNKSLARDHIQNWVDCVRSRQRPNADVEIAHRTTTVCHLCNISRELARRLHWNPEKEEFLGDEEANKLRSRPRRKGYELPKTL